MARVNYLNISCFKVYAHKGRKSISRQSPRPLKMHQIPHRFLGGFAGVMPNQKHFGCDPQVRGGGSRAVEGKKRVGLLVLNPPTHFSTPTPYCPRERSCRDYDYCNLLSLR
jgi:hypothetical protein